MQVAFRKIAFFLVLGLFLFIIQALTLEPQQAPAQITQDPTPVNIRVTDFSSDRFTVAWSNPVPAANRIWIDSSVTNVASLSQPTTAAVFAFNNANPATAYTIRVMLYTTDSASSYTPPIRINTKDAANDFSKPHDRFTDNQSSCKACHVVHMARSPSKLLYFSYDEQTTSYTTETVPLPYGGSMNVKRPRLDLCFNCHDGSGAENDIKSLYDNNLSTPGDFPGHATKVTGAFPGQGWKGNIKGMPARTQLPCMACHDVHSSSSRGENGQRGNTKMLSDNLFRYASATSPLPEFGNSKGNWLQTSSANLPYQYNYSPYNVINTTGFSEDQGSYEKCTVCHHGDRGDGDMIVAGIDEWLPTQDSKDNYGVTVPAHTDRKTCDCHVGNSYDQNKPNVHTLAKKPYSTVTNCASCHQVVYDYMKATSSSGQGHSSRNYHHQISVAATEAGKVNAFGSCTNLCHSDHSKRKPSDAFVLWTEVSTPLNPGASSLAYQTSANTDFIAGVSAGYSVQGGLCISCHRLQQRSHSTEAAAVTASQSSNANQTSGRLHAVISSTAYSNSVHNFTMTMGVANQDGSWFYQNCTKCHRDNQTRGYDTGTPLGSWSKRAWRGPHASDYNSMLVATTAVGMQEQTCFGNGVGLQPTGCHGRGRNPSWLDLEQLMVAPLFPGYSANSAHGKQITSVALDNRHLGLAEPGAYNAAASEQKDRSNPNTTAAGPPTRHVECQDCHNPHEATTQAYNIDDLFNPWPLIVAPGVSTSPFGPAYASSQGRSQLHPIGTDKIGGANLGVWGVDVDWNNASIKTASPSYTNSYGPSMSAFTPVMATKQWQLCFKCHSAYAYGEATASRPYASKHPRAGLTGVARQTPIPLEFNPKNFGYHPIVTIGANQPLMDRSERPVGISNAYNTNWPSMNSGTANFFTSGGKAMMTISNSTGMPNGVASHVRYGSFVAVGSSTPSDNSATQEWRMITKVINSKSFELMSSTVASNITYQVNAGLNSAFVPPWGPRSIVQCSDCHSPPSTALAQGPHGSSEDWALRGLDRNIKYSRQDGSVFEYNTTNIANVAQNNVNFCHNCHRADVYNWWGQSSARQYNGYSRITNHPPEDNNWRSNGGQAFQTGEWNIWCRRCHGGRSLGAMHGSSRGGTAEAGAPAAYRNTASSKRLLNGATWDGVSRGTKGNPTNCWIDDDIDEGDVANCGAGDRNGNSGPVTNYTYDVGPP